jgi:hypothetical protein
MIRKPAEFTKRLYSKSCIGFHGFSFIFHALQGRKCNHCMHSATFSLLRVSGEWLACNNEHMVGWWIARYVFLKNSKLILSNGQANATIMYRWFTQFKNSIAPRLCSAARVAQVADRCLSWRLQFTAHVGFCRVLFIFHALQGRKCNQCRL